MPRAHLFLHFLVRAPRLTSTCVTGLGAFASLTRRGGFLIQSLTGSCFLSRWCVQDVNHNRFPDIGSAMGRDNTIDYVNHSTT